MKNVVIIGADEVALEVTAFIERYNLFNVIGYAVNKEFLTSDSFNGRPLYIVEKLDSQINPKNNLVFIGISWAHDLNGARKTIFNQLKKRGFVFANLIAPSAVICGKTIGEGNWVHEYSYIGHECSLGDNNDIRPFASIGHYSSVGSHNHFAAKVSIGGKTNIGNCNFFGMNSIVFNRIDVGDKNYIGGGCVIKHSLHNFNMVGSKEDEPVLLTEEQINNVSHPNFWNKAGDECNCSHTKNNKKTPSEKVLSKVLELVSEVLHKDIAAPETYLYDSFNSLILVHLVSLLSDSFSINIPYYEIKKDNFDNALSIADMVENLICCNKEDNCDGMRYRTVKNNILQSDAKEIKKRFLNSNGKRKTIEAILFEHSINQPQKIAVIVKKKSYSFSQLYSMANKYASFLKSNGLKKGDIAVIQASQTIEFVVSYLAVHMLGAVVTSLEQTTPYSSIIEIARLIKAKVIISPFTNVNNLEFTFVNSKNVLLDLENYNVSLFEQVLEKDSADILFTTGTTGQSKGVELSHNALVATAENLIYGCGYDSNMVLIVPGPLNHANAIRKVFTSIINGNAVYILDGMKDIEAFFEALNYDCEKISCCLPPAFIRIIFQISGNKLGDYADKIDFIESASAPLPESDKSRLCELLPNTRLYNNYGSSESASVCMYDYNFNKGLENCVGKAMPNSEILIVDDNHNIINSSPSHMGFLACKGDVNMKCYIGEPELTKQVLDNGIVYTNDVGYIDKNGFIYVIGRKSDVINVGGLKVAPAEVESAVLGYDGIDDCIVVPINDSITGKALRLLVVLRKSYKLDENDLKKYLANRLEEYKIPHSIEIVDRIARTYNGKLDRKYYQQ